MLNKFATLLKCLLLKLVNLLLFLQQSFRKKEGCFKVTVLKKNYIYFYLSLSQFPEIQLSIFVIFANKAIITFSSIPYECIECTVYFSLR